MDKEEIEKAKENLQRSINDIWFVTLYSQEEGDKDTQILLNYIQQLENKVKGQQESIEYLRRSCDRKDERWTDEYHENVDLETKVEKLEKREQKVKDYVNETRKNILGEKFEREKSDLTRSPRIEALEWFTKQILNLLEGENNE